MATYTGTFKLDGKIWASIGGAAIATPKAGTAIKGDALVTGVDSVTYMHLTVPLAGYTKVSWLDYVADVTPPPPPVDPPPVPVVPAEVEVIAAKGTVINVKDTTGKIIFTYLVP